MAIVILAKYSVINDFEVIWDVFLTVYNYLASYEFINFLKYQYFTNIIASPRDSTLHAHKHLSKNVLHTRKCCEG